jgi:hypothetical protein
MLRLSLSQLSLPAISDSDKRAVASQKILQALSEAHVARASEVTSGAYLNLVQNLRNPFR